MLFAGYCPLSDSSVLTPIYSPRLHPGNRVYWFPAPPETGSLRARRAGQGGEDCAERRELSQFGLDSRGCDASEDLDNAPVLAWARAPVIRLRTAQRGGTARWESCGAVRCLRDCGYAGSGVPGVRLAVIPRRRPL